MNQPVTIAVRNTTNETIPPFAAMQVIGVNQDGAAIVAKPSRDGMRSGIVFNSGAFIVPGGGGSATVSIPGIAAFDASLTGDAPADGQSWGTAVDSWYLQPDRPGYRSWGQGTIVDTDEDTGFMTQAWTPGRDLFIRITGGGEAGSESGSSTDAFAYSWIEVVESEDGEWIVPRNADFGTLLDRPAYEIAKATMIPEGTIGFARYAADGKSVRFLRSTVASGSGSSAGSGLTKRVIDFCLAPCDEPGSGSVLTCEDYGYNTLTGPDGSDCCVDGGVSGTVTTNGGIPAAVSLTWNGSVWADSELTYTLDGGRKFTKYTGISVDWEVTLTINCAAGTLTGTTTVGPNTYDVDLTFVPGPGVTGSVPGSNCPYGFKIVKKMQWFDASGIAVSDTFCEDVQTECDPELFCENPSGSATGGDLSEGVPYPESLGDLVVGAECVGAGETIPGTLYFTFTDAIYSSIAGTPSATYLVGKSVKLVRTTSDSWAGIIKLQPATNSPFGIPNGPCFCSIGFRYSCSGRFSAFFSIGAGGTTAWSNLNRTDCDTATDFTFSTQLYSGTAPCAAGECASGVYRYESNLGTGLPFQVEIDILPVMGWVGDSYWEGVLSFQWGRNPIRAAGLITA